MLPHRKKATHEEGDGLRVGFEVHVIGGVRQIPASEDRGGVELGVQIGTGQKKTPTDDNAAAPVQRLEAEEPSEPLRARRLSEAVNQLGPATPYVPRGQRKERSLTTLTFWMAAVTCILAVAAVAAVMSARKKQAQAPDQSIVFTAEQSFGEEKAYFLDNLNPLIREAEALLNQYAVAKSPEQVLPLVRDSSRVKARLTALWHPMGGLEKSQSIEAGLVDDEVRPALVLKGRKADFAPFGIYFVRESGHLKIDWEASEGIGDAQLSELRASKTVVKGVKVRVTMKPGDFYTPEFPESDYRSYQLIAANGEEFVWAFVRKSSSTADLLEAELNESSVLLQKEKAVEATLRISGPLRENVNIFEITEMLHKGWISP
ncbi:MAG: hypothetical protein EOP83_03705 [Verrucomicrobiaceae bacterium]|nr:MAG: hypothetical protein EOP83_03705 [Verrucomicrobiaceae bacterium]